MNNQPPLLNKRRRIISISIFIAEMSLLVIGVIVYPQVFAVNSWGSQQDVPVTFPFIVNFNQPMIRSSVEPNIIISPSLEATFSWRDNNRQLIIAPKQDLFSNTTYTLTISSGRSYIGTKIENKALTYTTQEDEHFVLADFPEFRNSEKVLQIDLKKQTMSTWQDGKLLGEYLVSSGKRSTPTKSGEFEVLTKLRTAYGCSGGQCWRMPYWLGFYMAGATENGIHELPFISTGRGWFREGQNSLGNAVSHGCVRLGIGDAERIYSWAATGTPVLVHY